MMSPQPLSYAKIPPEAEEFREEVRTFLRREMSEIPALVRANNWMAFDAEFSRKLGAAGLIGIAAPRHLGGRGADAFARYVVCEELLAAGAPVSAHWIADRQMAPLLLQFGSEAQRECYIPGINRGEVYFCIGMSEPNSGSDLASIGTRAVREGAGWVLNGRKIWTTNAHHSHYMIALARTGMGGGRHDGLSQFIIDLSLPGISIRPIADLTGEAHFNEIFFDDVLLDETALVGTEGAGWKQVMAELAFERSGPERFLSAFVLLPMLIERAGRSPGSLESYQIGRIVSRIAALREMSLAVASELACGNKPVWAAACVKDLGTALEQEMPTIAQMLLDEPRSEGGADAETSLARIIQLAPSFSLRGGTREILRGIIAGGLGLR